MHTHRHLGISLDFFLSHLPLSSHLSSAVASPYNPISLSLFYYSCPSHHHFLPELLQPCVNSRVLTAFITLCSSLLPKLEQEWNFKIANAFILLPCSKPFSGSSPPKGQFLQLVQVAWQLEVVVFFLECQEIIDIFHGTIWNQTLFKRTLLLAENTST